MEQKNFPKFQRPHQGQARGPAHLDMGAWIETPLDLCNKALDLGDFAEGNLTGWGLKGAQEKNFQGVKLWGQGGPDLVIPKSGIGHLGPCQGHT